MLCGNGRRDSGEECDDGNTAGTDACTSLCLFARCGDGYVQGDEDCDEGVYNAFFSNVCRPDCRAPACGDGIPDDGEECDDGNGVNDDGCSTICIMGDDCGNGVVNAGEFCDDGNHNETDRCTSTCHVNLGEDCITNEECQTGSCRMGTCGQKPFCGDGIVDKGEECDQGPANSNEIANRCRLSCRKPHFTDGVVDRGELCDDGNLRDGDGCSAEGKDERIAGADVLSMGLPSQTLANVLLSAPRPGQNGVPLIGTMLDTQLHGGAALNNSGPAALVVMASGAAAGLAWIRRRRR